MILKYDNIHEYTIKCSNTSQITLDDDFNVPDLKPDIDSIIKECGIVTADNIRVNQDKALVEGTLKYEVLYTGKRENDAFHMPVKMDGSIHFSENINLTYDAQDAEVSCVANIEDLTIKSINSRKISVKAIISLTVRCEEINNVALTTDVSEEECTPELLYHDFDYVQMDVNMKDNLRIKENVSLPNGKADIGELIWDETDVRNLSTRMTEEGLNVTGDINIFIMYEAQDEGQPVQWYETSVPFSGVVDVSGANPESIPYTNCRIISKNIDVKPDYDGNNRDISVELVLDMDIKSYEECSKKAIWDIYVPACKMDIEKSNKTLKKLIIRNNTKCRVSGSVKVDDYVNLMQIVSASANVQIDDYEYVNEGIEVSGAVIVNVLYITSDDNLPMGSVNSAIPFTEIIEIKNFDKDNIEYNIQPSIEQLTASMNSSAKIEVKAVIALDTICFEPININVIDECGCEKQNEEYYASLPSIVGYISDGKKSLWDVAKKYNTTCDAIKKDNASVGRLEKDENIPKGTKLILLKVPTVTTNML